MTPEFSQEPAATSTSVWSAVRRIGLFAGPLLALITYAALPTRFFDGGHGEWVDLTNAARATLAVMTWMAVWWLTEAIDIAATALLPIVVFPLLGIASTRDAAAPYASSVIFLIFGGFVIALSMQRWGLDRRIALHTLRLVGTRPANMIGGFMLATAALSAFVSNTATTAMMVPIAASVVAVAGRRAAPAENGTKVGDAAGLDSPAARRFSVALMLAIAYSASIGGMTTIIGTAPNLFLVGYLRDHQGLEVSFVGWLRVGLPLAVVLLPLTWLLITRWLLPVERQPIPGVAATLRQALRDLGPIQPGERVTVWIFFAAALAWIGRPLLTQIEIGGTRPLAALSDAGIAMIAALALFAIPIDWRERTFTMNWATTGKLPWGVLILLGGGLSLASAIQSHQVAEFIGAQAHRFAHWPSLAIVLAITAATIFLTELTSNTATTATLVPILAALAPGLGVSPLLLVLPATLAASCAFMLPVATPPNAIVFASGQVTMGDMMRTGFWLNLLALLPITALAYAGLALL